MKKIVQCFIIALILLNGCTLFNREIINYYSGGLLLWENDEIVFLRYLWSHYEYLSEYHVYKIDIFKKEENLLIKHKLLNDPSFPEKIVLNNEEIYIAETERLVKIKEDFKMDTIMELGFVNYDFDKNIIYAVDKEKNVIEYDVLTNTQHVVFTVKNNIRNFLTDGELFVFVKIISSDIQQFCIKNSNGEIIDYFFNTDEVAGKNFRRIVDLKFDLHNENILVDIEDFQRKRNIIKIDKNNFSKSIIDYKYWNMNENGEYLIYKTPEEIIYLHNKNDELLAEFSLTKKMEY